jgi:hypothetical protein
MKALHSTEMSVTIQQLTGHNLHQLLCECVMSHRIEDRAGLNYCMTRLLRICEDHCHIHKSPILHNSTACVFFLLHVGANRNNTQIVELCIW